MVNDLCVFLPWDSDFFGLRIARIGAARLSPESLEAVLEWCRSEKIDCLYFLCDSSNIESVRLAEEAGSQLTDIRMTLQRTIGTGQLDAGDRRIRLFREADLDALKGIARVMPIAVFILTAISRGSAATNFTKPGSNEVAVAGQTRFLSPSWMAPWRATVRAISGTASRRSGCSPFRPKGRENPSGRGWWKPR